MSCCGQEKHLWCKDNANREQNLQTRLGVMPRCRLSYAKIMQSGGINERMSSFVIICWFIAVFNHITDGFRVKAHILSLCRCFTLMWFFCVTASFFFFFPLKKKSFSLSCQCIISRFICKFATVVESTAVANMNLI